MATLPRTRRPGWLQARTAQAQPAWMRPVRQMLCGLRVACLGWSLVLGGGAATAQVAADPAAEAATDSPTDTGASAGETA